MPLPSLPFGLTYVAIGVAVLAVLGAVLQQVFADQVSEFVSGWRRRAVARRRGLRGDGSDRYAAWAARTYRTAKLGFVQNAPVALDAVYVPLQYEHDGRRVDVYRDIQDNLRTVIIGAAGAGKSTILRHSMLQWAAAPQRFDRVPVLVELGRYNLGERSVQDLAVAALAVSVEPEEGPRRRRKRAATPLVDDADRVVPEALAAGTLCVFFDGLDEVVTDRRGDVAWDIKEFAERYPRCQIVVTCRDAVYDNDLGPTFDRTITVAGFDDAGIRQCLRLWFTRRGDAVGDAERGETLGEATPDPREQVEQLMAELRANPTLMRLARSPLMLTMIAFMHDVDPGEGPMLTNSRAEFYEQAVTHLLRRDPDLGRYRRLVRYKFAHKMMALRAIALAAQGDLAPGSDHRVITADEITAVMNRLRPRFQLDETDLPQMVNEIVERSGLLIRLQGAHETYEFAHLTLQEYLAAVELADEPDRILALYRENPSRWRETVKLWCAGAHRDATVLVRQIDAGDARDRLLALECVAESRNLDPALATGIVDGFADRLGTDLPDKHLVLAALGAVAGNVGTIGESLFDRLRAQAAEPGQVGADAVVVLAESRRRGAIETLSELAEQFAAARAALRSTGELAIPVLARRAAGGSLAAVDDLAAVGTPAAAVAIVEQLWGDREVAVRAAWHLAVLVSGPDVEAELTRFDPEPFCRGRPSGHDWLWAPFVPKSQVRHGIAVTMGRVGALVDESAEVDVPPDLGVVDVRLALGLGAQPAVLNKVDRMAWHALERDFFEAGDRVAGRRHRTTLLVENSVSDPVVELFGLIQQADPAQARELVESAVALVPVDGPHARLLRHLPAPMLIGLAAKVWNYSFRGATRDDWVSVNEQPERPTVLRRMRAAGIGVAVALGVAAVGVAVTRSVGSLIGSSWGWGPRWWAAVVLLGVVVAVVAVVMADFLFADFGSLDAEDVEIVAVPVAGIAVLVVALPTAAGWLGWPTTIAIILATVGVVAVLDVLTTRRERALRNPYRAALQLDTRLAQPGQTVIARGPGPRP